MAICIPMRQPEAWIAKRRIDIKMIDRPPTVLWGIDAPLFPLPGGHRNVALRTRELASDVVFKSTRRSEMALRWLENVFDCAEKAGLVVPRLFKSNKGQLSEQGWTMEPLLPGRPAQPGEHMRLAAPIRRLHEITAEFPQRPGFVRAGDLVSLHGSNKGGDIDLAAMPRSLSQACRHAWRALEDEPRGVVHGDLNSSNVLIGANGRLTLVDWDEARMDAVTFDLAQVEPEESVGQHKLRALDAWEIASSWQTEPDYARHLAHQFMKAAKQ